MYRKRGASLDLQEVLGKLAAKKAGREYVKPCPARVIYSSSDILAAKTVLDRLLAMNTRNEVSSIVPVPKELDVDEI